jgi:cytochrome c-type biogenesis protein
LIDSVVIWVSEAFYSGSAIAYAAALVWGLASVILSPCHLAAIPLLIGYVNEGKRAEGKRAFVLSLLFALGILVTLAIVGLVTSALGRIMGDIGPEARIAMGAFLALCGLWLMDVPPLSRISFSVQGKPERRGPLGALILGLAYGVVLGPCAFAFLAPMLGFVLSAGSGDFFYGLGLMALYALGHSAAIVAAGSFGGFVGDLLKRKGAMTALLWLKRGLGALVVIGGAIQIIG